MIFNIELCKITNTFARSCKKFSNLDEITKNTLFFREIILRMEFTRYYSSPLGVLEVSSSIDKITRIMFKEALKKPSRQLPESVDCPPILIECFRQLDAYFSGKLKCFDLAFELEGTAFQQNVWQKLQEIPFGETTTYLDLSRKIGNEKAIWAVGTANGMNPIAIIIPCHRVIGSDGSLVGYAGDIWRKEWLLNHEGVLPKQMNLFSV